MAEGEGEMRRYMVETRHLADIPAQNQSLVLRKFAGFGYSKFNALRM